MLGLKGFFAALGRLTASVNRAADLFDEAAERVRGQLAAGPEQLEGPAEESPRRGKRGG
jgi:hypothetical protein